MMYFPEHFLHISSNEQVRFFTYGITFKSSVFLAFQHDIIPFTEFLKGLWISALQMIHFFTF